MASKNKVGGAGYWVSGCLTVLLALAFGADAHGQIDATWQGGTGVWSDAGLWDSADFPNNGADTYNVFINNMSDDVTLDLDIGVNRLTNAGIFRFGDGFSLSLSQPDGVTNNGQMLLDHGGTSGLFGTLNNNGFSWISSGILEFDGDWNNEGTVWLGDGSVSGGPAGVTFLNDTTLNGAGEVYFYSAADDDDRPTFTIGAGNILTNGVDHRIHGGSGTITGGGTFENFGLVDADTPLRTLTIETSEFSNMGNLLAQSGNLRVTVDDWINEGLVRVSNGGSSTFSGTQLTNAAGATIEALGGASLSVNQNVTNFSDISAGAGGTLSITGSNRLVVNTPGATMSADGGSLRFVSTNGYLQNFGSLSADQGVIEFSNGMDAFGGDVELTGGSDLNVSSGTTTLTQMSTTLDAMSSLGVSDEGTGNSTLTYDGVTAMNGATLYAVSDTGGTTTFNLRGTIINDGGRVFADGGIFNFGQNNQLTMLESTGGLSLDIRNAGQINFRDVDSNESSMTVDWTGTGGTLSFNDYRNEATTVLDLSGWTADGGNFSVLGNSQIIATNLSELPDGTTLTVNNGGSRLEWLGLSSTGADSLVDLVGGGEMVATSMTVNGDFSFRGGTFVGDLHLAESAGFTVTSGSNRVTGVLSTDGDRDYVIQNTNTRLRVDGGLDIASGSSLTLQGITTVLEGDGLVTNSGLIESLVPNTNSSAFLDNTFVNTADGIVRASQNGTSTNTSFQIRGSFTNEGLMEAVGANLNYVGATGTNSGVIRGVDSPAGSRVIFQQSTVLNDDGGIAEIIGANSTLEVLSGADVSFTDLSVTNMASTTINSATLSVVNPFLVETDTTFLLTNNGVFNGSELNVDGLATIQRSTINSDVNVNVGGLLRQNSQETTINGAVHIAGGALNDGGMGTLSLQANNSRVRGSGLITNDGLIQGGAFNNNNSVFLENDVVNTESGVIRAFSNNGATNTFFQILNSVDNAGLMEADQANLYFNTANITNSGTIQTVDGDGVSQLIFLGNTQMADAGGSTILNGADSLLDISGGSDVHLGTLAMNDGSSFNIRDGGTTVMATGSTSLAAGSQSFLQNSATFDIGSLNVAGQLFIRNLATLNGSLIVGAGGEVVNTVGNASTINGVVNLQFDGLGGFGTLRLNTNNARFNGSGNVVNSGLVEGMAANTNNSTYLDKPLINTAVGVVRASQNGAATNTFFQLTNTVNNLGIMEAVNANLYFPGTTITNSGTIRSVDTPDGSRTIFVSGATMTDSGGTVMIDGPNSTLELASGSNVEAGTLMVTNSSRVSVIDAGSVLTALNDVEFPQGTRLTVNTSGLFEAPTTRLDGEGFLQGSGRIDTDLTIGSTGVLTLNSNAGFLDGSVVVERSMAEGGKGSFGVIELVSNNAQVLGTAVIDNHGEIRGGAPSNNNSTFLDNDVVNHEDGVIRAFRNGTPTGTAFQVRNNVVNAGQMVADESRLYMTTAEIDNSGVIEAINSGSIEFVNGTVVTDSGGTVRVSGDSVGSVSGGGTVVSATTIIDEGGFMSVTNSGRLDGTSVQVDGELLLQTSAVVDAPVTVGSTGLLRTNSQTVFVNDDVLVEGTAESGGSSGTIRINANSAAIVGTGVITNHGVIEGGANSNNNSTTLNNDIVNASDGTVRAYSNNGATGTTFNLGGVIDNEGMLVADGATLAINTTVVDNTGGSWSAINGGRLRVNGSFVGGSLGSNTTIDGDGSLLELVSGSLVGFDSLTLTNGGNATVNGANTSLSILSAFDIPEMSTVTVVNGGRLQSDGIVVDGLFSLRGGSVVSNVHVGATGDVAATEGVTTIDGNVTTTSGSLIRVQNNNERLTVDGTIDNVAGATIRLRTNVTALNGPGLLTNAGRIEGDSQNNNSTTTLSKNLNNSGEVVAFDLGTSTGGTFQLTSPFITNTGEFRAESANLQINGSTVTNSGTFRAEGGSLFTITGGATVSGFAGAGEVDGDSSLFRVLSDSVVTLGTLSLTNGGDVLVDDAQLTVVSPFDVGVDSVLTVQGIGTLSGGGVQVAGLLQANRGTIEAPTTIQAGGRLNVGSSNAITFNAPVTVDSAGALSDGGSPGLVTLYSNSVRMNGSGLVTNSGLIEGGANSNNNSVYLNNDMVNTSDGVVRAISNNGATNTFFQLTGNITNDGLMEADGGNLYFTGASVINSGTVQAIDNVDGLVSKLIFLNGSQFNNTGGDGIVDGPNSAIEISGDADVQFQTLTMSNGASGFLSNGGTTLFTDLTIGDGSSLTLNDSTVLGGAGASVSGTLTTDDVTISSPVTIEPSGLVNVLGTSGTGTIVNSPMAINRDGNGPGRMSLIGNNRRVSGAGLITNNGLIEGGASTGSNSVFLQNSLTNNADGVVRAFRSGSSSSTIFRLNGITITNNGVFEADEAQLRVGATGMVNNGTIRTLNSGVFVSEGPVTSSDGSAIDLADNTTASFLVSLQSDGDMSIGNSTVNVTNSLNFGANATFDANKGSVLNVGGSIGNASTRDDAFNMRDMMLNMTGAVVTIEAASEDLGADASGLTENFALGELVVSSSTSILSLLDAVDNQLNGAGNEVLYVETLTLLGGTTQVFLNGLTVYYGQFNGNESQIVAAGGSFLPIAGLVPEPATGLLLLVCGVGLLRRRGA